MVDESKPESTDGPFRVWSLDPAYYQYSWEERMCEGRFATLAEAVACARSLVRKAAERIVATAASPHEARREALVSPLDDVWIDGPGVSRSERRDTGTLVFDLKAELEAVVQARFGGLPAASEEPETDGA
ncbi:MAG: hypothetical protein CMJ34_13435 [Phycisphaerae bacterium]|nr:hypothetical protein [Phycisphaerae bacterium]